MSCPCELASSMNALVLRLSTLQALENAVSYGQLVRAEGEHCVIGGQWATQTFPEAV